MRIVQEVATSVPEMLFQIFFSYHLSSAKPVSLSLLLDLGMAFTLARILSNEANQASPCFPSQTILCSLFPENALFSQLALLLKLQNTLKNISPPPAWKSPLGSYLPKLNPLSRKSPPPEIP